MSDLVDVQGPRLAHRSGPSPVMRPDRTLIATVLLAVMTLAGALALLPGSEEKAEGLLAEGRYDDAIDMLVGVENERPLNGYEGYTLFKLYMLTRQPDQASMLIADQPALQVDNAWALRQLSDLYRQAGDTRGEASTLRKLYDISPSTTDFARLRVLYRLLGDTAGETSLLTRAISFGHAERSHLERLAYLQALSPASGRAALWVAPTGSFWHFEAPSPEVLALSSSVPSATTTLE